jgi:hypothetical protein
VLQAGCSKGLVACVMLTLLISCPASILLLLLPLLPHTEPSNQAAES